MKTGTGGTSGVEYLNKAAAENKAFRDLWSLSTFLIPSSALPRLPPEMKRKVGFHYTALAARFPLPGETAPPGRMVATSSAGADPFPPMPPNMQISSTGGAPSGGADPGSRIRHAPGSTEDVGADPERAGYVTLGEDDSGAVPGLMRGTSTDFMLSGVSSPLVQSPALDDGRQVSLTEEPLLCFDSSSGESGGGVKAEMIGGAADGSAELLMEPLE